MKKIVMSSKVRKDKENKIERAKESIAINPRMSKRTCEQDSNNSLFIIS